jgi:heat shock protein HslJ
MGFLFRTDHKDCKVEHPLHRIVWVLFLGIVLAGCAAGFSSDQEIRRKAPGAITDKTWQWEATVTPVEKITVPAPERYTILLESDGTVQARFDCNRGGGGYKISPGRLSFTPLMSTRMACPPDSLDSIFMRDLQRVVSFFVEAGSLYLEFPYDSGTMKFSAP